MRVHLSNLCTKKDTLKLVKANTSILVPRVYNYYKSTGFEHLVIERLPGITLEEAWPTLEVHEKERIADKVVAFLNKIQKLRSLYIKAALLYQKPL